MRSLAGQSAIGTAELAILLFLGVYNHLTEQCLTAKMVGAGIARYAAGLVTITRYGGAAPAAELRCSAIAP